MPLLQKNQWAFGNKPELNAKKLLVSNWGIVSLLSDIFSGTPEIIKSLKAMIVEHFYNIGLDGLDPELKEKCLEDAIISYEEFSRMFSRRDTKTVVKGKSRDKKLEKIEKLIMPTIPSTSKVIFPSEMKVIRQLLTQKWGTLSVSNHNWVDVALSGSYKETKELVGQGINRRWALLDQFGSLTVNRLKTVRNDLSKPDMQKKDVTIDQLRSVFAKKRGEIVKQFTAFLQSMLMGDEESKLFVSKSLQFGVWPSTKELANQYIVLEAFKDIEDNQLTVPKDLTESTDLGEIPSKVISSFKQAIGNWKSVVGLLMHYMEGLPGNPLNDASFERLCYQVNSMNSKLESISDVIKKYHADAFVSFLLGLPSGKTFDDWFSQWEVHVQRITSLIDDNVKQARIASRSEVIDKYQGQLTKLYELGAITREIQVISGSSASQIAKPLSIWSRRSTLKVSGFVPNSFE
jgi:phage pi2 protein 07